MYYYYTVYVLYITGLVTYDWKVQRDEWCLD